MDGGGGGGADSKEYGFICIYTRMLANAFCSISDLEGIEKKV